MIKIITILCTSCLLIGCAGTRLETNPDNLGSKASFQKLSSGGNKEKVEVSAMRTRALRDTALSVGARGGLFERASQLNQMLSNYEPALNRVFNFHHMILDDNVLPPVLVEARNTLNIKGDDVIRVQERNYEILQQAKFITTPPTWRDYLWMNYAKPEKPDNTLLPRNRAEQIIWKKYINQGWSAGITQAMFIFRENLSRLQRDYLGMIRYRSLLAQRMVSPPYVATLDLGITGGPNQMSVNDRVLRITAFPTLQSNSEQWKTEIYQHE